MSILDLALVQDKTDGATCFDRLRIDVDQDEFCAWAAYSGIDVSPAPTGDGLYVVIRSEIEESLLREEWVSASLALDQEI